MCLVSKPKIPAPTAAEQSGQNLPVIHNPLLDGLVTQESQGNNPFRIDLINPLTIPGGPQTGSIGSGFGGGGTSVTPPSATGSRTGGSGSFTGGFGGSGGRGLSSDGVRTDQL